MPPDPKVSRAQACYVQAEQLLQAGKLTDAQVSIRKALALCPQVAEHHALLALIYRRMNKAVLADKAFADARGLGWVEPPPPPAAEPVLAPRLAEAAVATTQPALAATAPLPELNRGERRALLEGAARCLGQLTALQREMQEHGIAGDSSSTLIEEAREMLAGGIKAARDAWRAQNPAPGQQPGPELPARAASAEYQGIPAFSHTLGAGGIARGAEVNYLQRLLNLEGFHVPVSGNYDLSTKVAVQKLQEKHGLKKQDGVVNVETRQILNRLTGHANTAQVP